MVNTNWIQEFTPLEKRLPEWCASGTGFAGRLFFFALYLTLALIFPSSKTAAQGAAPAGENEMQVQLVIPPTTAQSGAPIKITLQDALERARKADPTLVGAVSDAKNAHEDRIQARNAMLPQISATTQYLGTQGNGGLISDGRFVTNDGVHVYRAWGVYHEDLSPATLMGTAYSRTKAAEAMAKAKAEIARRGLTVAVSKNFYALVVAQRKLATAQEALDQAKHLFADAQSDEKEEDSAHSADSKGESKEEAAPSSESKTENQGEAAGGGAKEEDKKEAAHTDRLKAELQYRLQKQAFDEARLAVEDARLDLTVMLFPTLNENFSVVDDLDSVPSLPPFAEVQSMAEKENPDLRVAMETARESDLDVTSAKTAFLPTLTVDTDYGMEANCFAIRCPRAAFPEIGSVPNIGYFVTVVLNVPVWDWGTLRSKLHEAENKQQTAKVQLSQAQRQAVGELYALYNEAVFARSAVEESRQSAEVAAQILESPGPEVQEQIDAQSALLAARNAYIDAQARSRAALANLQTMTGTF